MLRMVPRGPRATCGLILAALLAVHCGKGNAGSSGTATGGGTTSTASGGTGTGATGAGGAPAPGTYPWPVWDGKTPAVPPSTTGATWYVDGKGGDDAHDGKSKATAFATVKKAVSAIAPGDTVLILAGLYREGVDLTNAPVGTASKPITFGSYGDGEVILDGSTAVTGWKQVNGTVWKAPVTFTPIAVVVNEVPRKQVTQGQGGSTAPQVGLAGVTPGSGKWYFDAAGKTITADVGAVDPNTADVVVPSDDGGQTHVYFYQGAYYVFDGLTVRGSGASGIWGTGSNITVQRCDLKFNGKGAVSFQEAGSDNAVLLSHAYHNVLLNWPRGNNGFAESGGGWAGGVGWEYQLRPLARGNVVHMNGGEGIISYGTEAGSETGHALFEENVVYDNWSVNIYFDNQPYDVARQNFLFAHPPDTSQYLYYDASTDPWNSFGKGTVCLMLADEEGSSDATNNYANLDHSQVYDNIMAGCRIGIRDYSEGDAHAVKYHGLKNTLIANNTILLAGMDIPNTDVMGIFLQDNTTPSGTNRNASTVIEDNLVYGFNQDPVVWSEIAGALGGITLDHNVYFSAAGKPFRVGNASAMDLDFTGWRSTVKGSDAASVFADPLLTGATSFQGAGAKPYPYQGAAPKPGSPALTAGVPQTAYTTNFAGQPKAGATWSAGAF